MKSRIHRCCQPENKIKFTRPRIIKNFIVITSSFMLLFTAYDGLSMLQTTMNKESGIGSLSQAVVYLGFTISSLLLPKYLIKKLGCKDTLFIAIVLYIPYIAANFHPQWTTMMPTAVLIGIGASILWGSQNAYFKESSVLYCTLDDEEDEEEDVNTSPDPLRNRITEVFSVADNTRRRSINDEVNGECDSVQENKVGGVEGINLRNTTAQELLVKELILRCEEQFKKSQKIIDTTTWKSDKAKDFVQERNSKNRYASDNCFPIRVISKDVKPGNPRSRRPSIQTPGNILTERINPESYASRRRGTVNTDELNYTIESAAGFFFGCHGLAYYTSQVWSNLMSYYILNANISANANVSDCSCGANFCNNEFECNSDDVDEITFRKRFLLTGISVVLGIAGALVVLLFLDPLDTDKESIKFSFDHVKATFYHFKKKEQIFLVPISLYVGMAQGFYTADITKSYIACAWGTSHVGLISIFYGLACALSSTISGYLVQFMGRVPIFLLGQGINMMNYVFLLFWSPEIHHKFMFFLAAGLWGSITGLFWSQIQALHGVMFKKDEESAIACYYLCSSLGWTISFLYSNYLCTTIKIYILMGVSCAGIIGYLLTERIHSLDKRQMHLTCS